MKVYAISDIGKVRPINEDSYYAPAEGEQFCAVADGMGGHKAGEVASALAIETFADRMRSSGLTTGSILFDAVERANAAVFSEASKDERKSGMGTTFTALCEDGNRVHIAHVGDSRAYLVRNGVIMRVTMDHTLVAEMVLQGLITSKEAKVHPKRNYITRALGMGRQVEIDLLQLDVHPDDVFLLCTDGLSNHVEDRDMLAATLGAGEWPEKLQRLIDMALEAGGSDNVTAMYVTFGEEHQ